MMQLITEESSPPLNLRIIHINVTSFHLMWSPPKYPHGSINYYRVSSIKKNMIKFIDSISMNCVQVYYKRNEHDQSEQVVNVMNFNGTYILDNLTPYTEYSVYVTAVRSIGDTGRPLEGMKTTTLIGRTLAGSG